MPEDEDSRDEARRLAKRGGLLDVNASIREAAVRLGSTEANALWEFICECGAPGCHAMLALTLAQYDALRGGNQVLVADGHGLRRAAKARRSTHERSDEARALRAQATLQQQRAQRNLEPRDA